MDLKIALLLGLTIFFMTSGHTAFIDGGKQDISGGTSSPEGSGYLGDFAGNVIPSDATPTDPELDLTGWDDAIRQLSVNDKDGTAELVLLKGGEWFGKGISDGALNRKTETNNIQGGTTVDKLADKLTKVPTPAAAWLFGSALLGFICFSRRTSI